MFYGIFSHDFSKSTNQNQLLETDQKSTFEVEELPTNFT